MFFHKTFPLQKPLDKDKEQARLEVEMQKRRERIEKWRADKKKKEMESAETGQDESQPKEAKKWSLEEEESDEDENGANGAEDGVEAETELDPLDAYMTEVSKEVRKIKGGINVKNSKVFNKNAKNEGTTVLHYTTRLQFCLNIF